MRALSAKAILLLLVLPFGYLLFTLYSQNGSWKEVKSSSDLNLEAEIKTIIQEYLKENIVKILNDTAHAKHQTTSEDRLKSYIDRVLKDVPRRKGQELLPTCKAEKQNFVYIKNHKCASDTLSVAFRRFGYDRNLSLVQPMANKYNIGWPKPLNPGYYRASKSGTYNILTEHTVYDETYMRTLMPADSVYITSIREPFSHLKSSFNFFNVLKLGHINEILQPGEDPLLLFLNDMDRIDKQYQDPHTYKSRPCVPPYLSVVRNMMAFDLGFPVGYGDQSDKQGDVMYMKKWLADIDKKFDVVMLVEHFHESLVMLKRMMCWTAKDILYQRVNTSRRKTAPVVYPKDLVDRYLNWTLPDTLMYEHFQRTFWDRVDAMGADDFTAEVDDFNTMLSRVIEFCKQFKSESDPNHTLRFSETRWNPTIEIHRHDCLLINSRTGIREELRQKYDNDPRPVVQPQPPDGKVFGC